MFFKNIKLSISKTVIEHNDIMWNNIYKYISVYFIAY